MSLKTMMLLALPAASLARVAHAVQGQTSTQLRASPREAEVANDQDATILDFSAAAEEDFSAAAEEASNPTLHFTGLGDEPFQGNDKNGTPWFRTKHTSGRGTAGHAHFDGLVARGEFVYDALKAHNVVRDYAGVRRLQWSEDLEALAKTRVHKLANEGCYIQHSPTSDRWQTNGFFYIGENLYKVINMVPTGVDIVDAWYAEIEDYTFGRVGKSCVRTRCSHRQSPPCTVGHFTQVMWQESKFLGCARAECPNQAKRTFVAVCNYGEGGNIANTLPFWPENADRLGLGKDACPAPVSEHEPTSYAAHNATVSQHKSSAVGRSPTFVGALAAIGALLTAA